MRKVGAALITALLITAVAGTQIVNLAEANPHLYMDPPKNAKPPVITILSPENNTALPNNEVPFAFTVSPPDLESGWSMSLGGVKYREDWNNADIILSGPRGSQFNFSTMLKYVPEGNRSIRIGVISTFWRYEDGIPLSYDLWTEALASFTVDTAPPEIRILPMKNETDDGIEIPLNFTLSEVPSQISYVLDGQDNVTIQGNSTLTEISSGVHNVTVYAWDAAGNVGATETVTFTVAETESEAEPEGFPTVPVAAMSAVSIAAVATAGLLLYNRKRRKEA